MDKRNSSEFKLNNHVEMHVDIQPVFDDMR